MSDERERDILREIRSIYVGGDGVVLSRERLGIVVGHMAELETRIHDLTAERDQARTKLAKLREACKDVLRWLDSSGYGDDHDAITSIEAASAIRAALESEAGE